MSTLEQKSGDSRGTLVMCFLSHFLLTVAIFCLHQETTLFDSGVRKLVLSSASSLGTHMPSALPIYLMGNESSLNQVMVQFASGAQIYELKCIEAFFYDAQNMLLARIV